jgi:hypothetical protein
VIANAICENSGLFCSFSSTTEAPTSSDDDFTHISRADRRAAVGFGALSDNWARATDEQSDNKQTAASSETTFLTARFA